MDEFIEAVKAITSDPTFNLINDIVQPILTALLLVSSKRLVKLVIVEKGKRDDCPYYKEDDKEENSNTTEGTPELSNDGETPKASTNNDNNHPLVF